jgi:prephenate dehydratase
MDTVAIQGISGAFHEEAALKYFGAEIKTSSSKSFLELLNKVAGGDADYGIIAIENTVAGTIHSNLQLLKESNLFIIGEINLRIEQNLAALPGTDIQELTEVRSHYMALNQAKLFLDQHPQIIRINDLDTATSLKAVSNNQLKNVGAIGSRHGAELYGLEIIASGIETHKLNYTRFLAVSNEVDSNHSNNKSSWLLKLKHEKGALASLLMALDQKDINLSKIESFPIIGEPWHYEFFIDLEFEDLKMHLLAEKIISDQATSHVLLGTYKAFVTPGA